MAWANLVIVVVISVPVLVLSLRSLSDARLAAWMETRGVPVTTETRQLVRRELHRTRRWRAYGVVAAVAVQGLVSGLYAGQYPDFPAAVAWLNDAILGWPLPIVGYGVGAFAAEWWGVRPAAVGRAVVSTRELSHYVSSRLLRMLRWLPVAVAALVPLPLLVPVAPSWVGHEPSVSRMLLLAVGAVVAWAVAEPLARRIVRRRQRIADPALVRADDALRSAAVHAVVAVGIALQLLALSSALYAIGTSAEPRPIRWVFPLGSLVCLWTAFAMWVGYAATSFPFAVRRPVAAAAANQNAAT